MSSTVEEIAARRTVLRALGVKFQKQFGEALPRTYCAWDTETTGFDKSEDLIIDIGHCLVRDSVVVHRMSAVLDWTQLPEYISEDWLDKKLANVRKHLSEDGRVWPYDVAYLKENGKNPLEVLQLYYDLFNDLQTNKGFFIGQNVYNFDAKMLAHHFKEWLGKDFNFDPNIMFDVGLVEKASFTGQLPFADEPVMQFFNRVAGYRVRGLRWNIQTCLERYDLIKEHDLDIKELHGAAADSYACHLLYEKLREYSELY